MKRNSFDSNQLKLPFPEEEQQRLAAPVINLPLRVGTLFSGIGAFEEALKQLHIQHEIVFACDNGERYLKKTFDEIMAETPGMTQAEREEYVNQLYEKTGKINWVKKSYFANYDITEDRWHEDVRFMDGTQYRGQVDILVGGSPCQSFSTYGKKRGLEDTRGTLFYDYARMIQEVQPKIFIYENVRGLLCHDKGKTWKVINEVFDSLDYDIGNPQVLNAENYGLPQMRKRLFVIGIKRGIGALPFNYPLPIPLTRKSTDYLERDVPIEYYLPEKGFKWTTDVSRNQNKSRINRDIIGCQTAVQQYNWSGDFRLETPKQEHRDSNYVYVGKYNGKDAVVRKLMPIECLRLMGFENFNIVVEDQIAYRQAGNSIAVPVLKAIIKSIAASAGFEHAINDNPEE